MILGTTILVYMEINSETSEDETSDTVKKIILNFLQVSILIVFLLMFLFSQNGHKEKCCHPIKQCDCHDLLLKIELVGRECVRNWQQWQSLAGRRERLVQ